MEDRENKNKKKNRNKKKRKEEETEKSKKKKMLTCGSPECYRRREISLFHTGSGVSDGGT